MRISGPSRTTAPVSGAAGRRAEGGGAAFAPSGGTAPARAATTTTPLSLGGLDGLLALQSIDADRPRGGRRRAVKQGHDLLDVLDEIRIGLLSGGFAPSALDRIATMVGALEPSGDEGLDALVSEIALRAEVEMAKLGRFVERR